jgi:hypothetical protein
MVALLRTGEVHDETDAELDEDAYDEDVVELEDTVTGLDEPDEYELLLFISPI